MAENNVNYENTARGKQFAQRQQENEIKRENRLARYRRNAEDSAMLNANADIAHSSLKFCIILPLIAACFSAMNGDINIISFESFLNMLTGVPSIPIDWIPKISGITSGMSDLAQKIFGFILKPIEWVSYVAVGLTQSLTFVVYFFKFLFM